MTEPAEVYAAAFAAQCAAGDRGGRAVVEADGLVGLPPSAEHPVIRLLVTHDRAHGVLASVLPLARAGMVTVFERAERCAGLLRDSGAWKPESTTALAHLDLQAVPATALPRGLELRPVRRLAGDPPEGVPLEDAVAAAMRADPRIRGPQEAFATFLRALPATRLFAAVDGGGVVRATSGCTVSGGFANVLFVNTDPAWRGRGIARAMTAAALREAGGSGARNAVLDATDAGLPAYLRLGFEIVSPTTRFFHPGPPG